MIQFDRKKNGLVFDLKKDLKLVQKEDMDLFGIRLKFTNRIELSNFVFLILKILMAFINSKLLQQMHHKQ